MNGSRPRAPTQASRPQLPAGYWSGQPTSSQLAQSRASGAPSRLPPDRRQMEATSLAKLCMAPPPLPDLIQLATDDAASVSVLRQGDSAKVLMARREQAHDEIYESSERVHKLLAIRTSASESTANAAAAEEQRSARRATLRERLSEACTRARQSLSNEATELEATARGLESDSKAFAQDIKTLRQCRSLPELEAASAARGAKSPQVTEQQPQVSVPPPGTAVLEQHQPRAIVSLGI